MRISDWSSDVCSSDLKAYADAMAKHLWDGQYGATTAHEYWAEGTQFWFNSNKLAVIDGKSILSDADLSRHDPALAAALKAVYGDRHHLPGDPFYRHPDRKSTRLNSSH